MVDIALFSAIILDDARLGQIRIGRQVSNESVFTRLSAKTKAFWVILAESGWACVARTADKYSMRSIMG